MDTIATVEKLAIARKPEALAALMRLFRALATGTELAKFAPGEPPAPEEVLATRVAAAAATILADPKVTLDDATLAQLAVLGRGVENLHAISGFGTADHLLGALGATDTASLAALATRDPAAFRKAAMLLPIDSRLPIDPEALLAGPPAIVLLAVLNLLCAKPITTLQGHARRDRLLALADRLPAAPLPSSVDHLVLLGNAWMLCSYAEGPGKHAVKRVLNRVLREWVLRHGMRDVICLSSSVHRDRARPVGPVASQRAANGAKRPATCSPRSTGRFDVSFMNRVAKTFAAMLATLDVGGAA